MKGRFINAKKTRHQQLSTKQLSVKKVDAKWMAPNSCRQNGGAK